MTFYEKFVDLCNQKGMSPAAVVREIGLNNSSSTAWKRGSIPKAGTLKKLADYFGVSIDQLLSDDIIEKMYNMRISHVRISDGQPLSHEAMLLAEDYDTLDYWGRKQVRTITDIELERLQIPRYNLQDIMDSVTPAAPASAAPECKDTPSEEAPTEGT